MKLNCGPTWEEKRDARKEWHDWFAWYPVRIGSNHCRWLETVERKGTFRRKQWCEYEDFWIYEYRVKE